MSDVPERYSRVAKGFAHRVTAVEPAAWDRPTPCAGWVARDVVAHLVEWVPDFFSSWASVDLTATPSADADPAAAWASLDEALRGLLADPATANRRFGGPMGPTTVSTAVDQIVTPDVLIHTWDLARAIGLDDTLDPNEVEGMREAMEPFDAQLRASGHYGPRVAVAPDADHQEQLIAFLGRDPSWSPT